MHFQKLVLNTNFTRYFLKSATKICNLDSKMYYFLMRLKMLVIDINARWEIVLCRTYVHLHLPLVVGLHIYVFDFPLPCHSANYILSDYDRQLSMTCSPVGYTQLLKVFTYKRETVSCSVPAIYTPWRESTNSLVQQDMTPLLILQRTLYAMYHKSEGGLSSLIASIFLHNHISGVG